MSNLTCWLDASLGNKQCDRFMRLLAEHIEICQLFAQDGRLYISYKRRGVIKQFPNVKMSHMEQGFRQSGFWCPDGKIDNYGWMTWTKIKPVPAPVHAPIQPISIGASVHIPPRVRRDKFTYAPDWLNTNEWKRVFLPRDPRPPNIDGSWINNL